MNPKAGSPRPSGISNPRTSLRILAVDDHPPILHLLAQVFQSSELHPTVVTAQNGLKALEKAAWLRPGIVIMDYNMPGMNGAETTRRLLELSPQSKVIGFSAYSDSLTVSHMLAAGASGFVSKDSPEEELLDAVAAVRNGKKYFSSTISQSIKEDQLQSRINHLRKLRISRNDKELIVELGSGGTGKDIAKKLEIDRRAVEKRKERIRFKLGVKSNAEVIRFGIHAGIIPLH